MPTGHYERKRKGSIKPCAACGQHFYVYPYAKNRRQYCSIKCGNSRIARAEKMAWRQDAVELYLAGKSIRDVARSLGRSRNVVQQALRERNIAVRELLAPEFLAIRHLAPADQFRSLMRESERYLVMADGSHSPCIDWEGRKFASGNGRWTMTYGVFAGSPAHRWWYEHLHGTLSKELVLDHLCRNTLCVNASHLEPVTIAENVLRGFGAPAQNKRKTECIRGHEFTPENTYRRPNDGGRECVICRRMHGANSKARKRARRNAAV